MAVHAPEKVAVRDPRELISAEEFTAVSQTVQRNSGLTVEVADRITAEALKFVAAAAQFPGQGMRPSRVVDEGWHALILHTYTYHLLCQRLGVFVHHCPEAPDPTRYDKDALARTTGAVLAAGFEVDQELWRGPEDRSFQVAADCQHGPGGPEGTCNTPCTDKVPSPNPN
ncbi:glycine-rich domain-containing protein [Streptomyces sp. NPDC008079]|uniref:glycine-rich domain-containing protein n=1 Tax=Streptomyces sp. NPDC008079 TaxID=3364806 RepID=UPI0036E96E12